MTGSLIGVPSGITLGTMNGITTTTMMGTTTMTANPYTPPMTTYFMPPINPWPQYFQTSLPLQLPDPVIALTSGKSINLLEVLHRSRAAERSTRRQELRTLLARALFANLIEIVLEYLTGDIEDFDAEHA